MAIINTNLTNYINENADNIITDLFYDYAPSFRILNIEPQSYPSKLLVDFSDTTLVYGNGSAIKVSDATGADEVADFEINAYKISAIKGFSQAALDQSILSLGRQNRIDPSELTGQSIFLDLNAKTIVQDNERRLWLGSTSLTGDNVLKAFNGIVVQVSGATGVGEAITTVTGSTIAPDALTSGNAIVEIYNIIEIGETNFPELINGTPGDAEMFMSPKNFATFKRAYFESDSSRNADKISVNSNLVELDFDGTSTRIYSMPGMSGSNEILWTRKNNFGIATDFEGAVDGVEFWYSQDEAEHYLRSIFALGAFVKRTQEVVRYTKA